MKAWRAHRSRRSQSSELEGISKDERDNSVDIDFHFSEEESGSSLSSEEEEAEPSWKSDVLVGPSWRYQPPNAPKLSYNSSPPETPREGTPLPISPTRHVAEAGPLRSQRPSMRIDLSTLPPPFAATSRLSPRRLASPRLTPVSRFSSSDDSTPASALTPGTEHALSAFGIAAGRRTPLIPSPMPTPPLPLRGRRRYMADSMLGDSSDEGAERRNRSSPRPPSSPLQHLVAIAAPSSASSSEDEADQPRQQVSRQPRTPLMDYAGARAMYHRLLPGDHSLLRTGSTPAIEPGMEASYFAMQT